MANPRKMRARVTSVEKFGDETYVVAFKPEGSVPRFMPGQFLHLTVDEYDSAGGFWPQSRVFSIASAPDAAELTIIYSVKGRYTKLMEERIHPGCEIWLKLPYGEFVIESAIDTEQDCVLVAGGTGISPYLPFMEKKQGVGKCERVIRLYYGVREHSMLLALDLLNRCSAAGLVDVHIFVEREVFGRDIPVGLQVERGSLDINRIFLECQDLKRPVFFLSGPPGMITAFKGSLCGSGIEAERIKIDEWE